MELPKRTKGDEYTSVGEYPELRRRIRAASSGLSIPAVVAYAFDNRTRLVPYFYSSHRMAPAGARAVAAALHDSGLTKTRVVLQQWTPNFRPSRAKLDGEPLEMLLVSSMQIHAERAYRLIADACALPAQDRPLILGGGPKAIYEPWDLFDIGGDPNVSADVVVTGEEFVLMQLVEVLLEYRAAAGTMRAAFHLARADGALAGIPGLVYRQDDSVDSPLVTTGIQRLVQDLDEIPHPVIGYQMLERPHRGRDLKSQPLPTTSIWRHSPIGSLSISHGCKFNCDYCPIPAYNQKTYRHKSGDRIVDEMRQLREQLGIRFFFGTDDNFFNDRTSAEELFQKMAVAKIGGKPLRKMARWGTEATEFDTWKNRDLLPAARLSGLRALWMGLEDITATLINKGQSVNKTEELFAMLNKVGISPMPMMMHHDGQPLRSKEGMYGLLNQVKFLRKIGAQGMQVTVLTPAVGTRSYEGNFENRSVFDAVGGTPLLQYQFDGNNVVASTLRKPWRTQLNVLIAYLSFYNPINFARMLLKPANSVSLGVVYQVGSMIGLVKTALHSVRWSFRLWRGPITRRSAPSQPKTPMIDVSPPEVQPASAEPPTPTQETLPVTPLPVRGTAPEKLATVQLRVASKSPGKIPASG